MILRLLIGILFVASFSVGIEFIGVPVAIGLGGFWPGVFATIAMWLYSLALGLLYVETTLAFPDGSNAMTFSRTLLGPFGRLLTGLSYAYIHYSFLLFYFIVLPPMTSVLGEALFGVAIPLWASSLGTFVFYGGILFLGTSFTLALNALMFVGLMIIFSTTVSIGGRQVMPLALSRTDWIFIVFSLPALFNSYYFHSILPTLASYLKRNRTHLKISLWAGTSISLVIFLIWIGIVIGSSVQDYILEAFDSPEAPWKGYLLLLQVPFLGKGIEMTAYLAGATSLFTAGVAFIDIWSDWRGIPLEKRKGWSRLWICSVILLPPLALSFLRGHRLIRFINYTVGYGELIASAILPLWWVWILRKSNRLASPPFLSKENLIWWICFISTILMFYFEGLKLIHQSTF